MSGRSWLAASAMTALCEQPALYPLTVFDAPPVRGAMPYAIVEDPVLGAWDLSGVTGLEGRMTISLVDDGERPALLRMLIERVEALLLAMPRDLGGEGWRLARLALARSRIVRAKVDGQSRWTGASEFQVKIYRANA